MMRLARGRTALHRIRPLLCAFGLLLLTVLAPATLAQEQRVLPDPVPAFHDPDGIFSEEQARTLGRDAQLLQSSKIPMLVVARIASAEAASPEQARADADELRYRWSVEGQVDANESLVLLYSHVPDNGTASTIVASWGDHAFDHSGLTPDYIESVLDGDPRALLDRGHFFEALSYGMREIRYGGIYFPPPPAPLTGVRQALHTVLAWSAPLVTIAAIGALGLATFRPGRLSRRRIALATGTAAALLAILAVIGQSRIGIASTLLIIAALGIAGWRWTHPRAAGRPSDRGRLLPDVLLALLFFAISLGANIHAIPHTATHPDESRWLNRAYYARDLGDPFGPTWQDYVTTRGQPPLGSIVMGIGLAIQGKPLDSVNVWDFAYDSNWNTWMGAYPADDIRTAGRRTNAVIGACVVAVVYVLGRLMTNRVGGAAGALFLAFHPLHIMLSTQALSDQTLALLLALIFLTGWWFARQPTWTRAILLGVLLGLGGAVKLTPLLLSGPLAAFGLLRLILDRDPAARAYATKMAAQPLIAFATFVAIYPYLWPAPIRRTWELYAFRATEMAGQGAAWPNTAVSSPLDALGRFGNYLAHTATSRRLLGPLAGLFGFDRGPSGLDYIPAVAGLLILLWWVAKRGFWTPAAMVALLMGAEAATLIFGMKTDFYRYHLPIVAIMAVCITISVGAGWSALARLGVPFAARSRQRRTPLPTPSLGDPMETHR